MNDSVVVISDPIMTKMNENSEISLRGGKRIIAHDDETQELHTVKDHAFNTSRAGVSKPDDDHHTITPRESLLRSIYTS
jgi:hypothetical protein